MIGDGSAKPRVYAADAKSASVSSKGDKAVIAFEGTLNGRKSILCEVLR